MKERPYRMMRVCRTAVVPWLCAALVVVTARESVGAENPPGPVNTPCKAYPIMRVEETHTVTIDGRLDEWGAAASFWLDPLPAAYWGKTAFGGTTDLSARVMVMSDHDGLYVAACVTDDAIAAPFADPADLWRNDGVELFVDFDLHGDAGTAACDADDFQFVFCPLTLDMSGGELRPDMFHATGAYEPRPDFAFARTPDGYTLEARLPAPTPYRAALETGTALGLNVAVNDMDSPADDWEAQIRWFSPGKPSEDARARHHAELVATPAQRDAERFLSGRVTMGTVSDLFAAGSEVPVLFLCDPLLPPMQAGITAEHESGALQQPAAGVPVQKVATISVPLIDKDTVLPEDTVLTAVVRTGDRAASNTWSITMSGTDYSGVAPSRRGRIWGDVSREVILSDLSAAQPASALAETYKQGHWRVIPYTTPAFAGKLILANYEAKAMPVELSLDVQGWHAVWIGFWTVPWVDRSTEVLLRLDTNDHYIRCHPPTGDYLELTELFWKYVDIQKGDTLGIAQQGHGYASPASVAFVRLVPLRLKEIEAVEADRADPQNRRLVAFKDGFSDIYTARPETAEEIEAWIEPYRNSDFKRLCWELGSAGKAQYPSQLTPTLGGTATGLPRAGDRYFVESLQILTDKGVNPLEVACSYAHRIGLEFYVSQRAGAWMCTPPFDDMFGGKFFDDHPQWRCMDKDGVPVTRLSYAYEGVRLMVINLFREAAFFGADGIHIIYVRGVPFVLYEEPVARGFERRYGENPRSLPEDDPRWMQCKADVMTAFMRELRNATLTWKPAPDGKPVRISAHVFANEKANMQWALDVRAWVEEGLIDALLPYAKPSRQDSIDVDFYGDVCRNSSAEWYCDISPASWDPRTATPGDIAYVDQARRAYAAGADGITFWDTNGEDPLFPRWHVIQRLGHREGLDEIDHGPFTRIRHKLVELNGHREDRYPSFWGY